MSRGSREARYDRDGRPDVSPRMLRGVRLFAATTLFYAFSPAAAEPVDLDAHSQGEWAFDLSGRDTSVRPGDDFFSYANGTYLQKPEIPADRTWYGTINVLRDLSEARVHAILDDAAANVAVEPSARDEKSKVGAFY